MIVKCRCGFSKDIKTKGIQILTKNNKINTHYTEDGIFFQKRNNTKTFYWKPKNSEKGFGKNYEFKYSRVCSYLKNCEWVVIP